MGPGLVPLTLEGQPVRLAVRGPEGGPVVLFAHPFPLHGGAWEAQLEACAQAGMRAAAVDAPGFGGTPALGRPFAPDDFARLLAASLDALGAHRASLVGCSMGGYALMAFARLFPGRMARAVLVCTKASADSPEAKAARETGALAALAQGAPAALAGLLPKLVAPGVPEREPRLWARVQELAAGATAQGVADALRGLALRPDSRPTLAFWPGPALVIAGEHDQLMPLAELQALAAGIPGARLTVIEGAGHFALLERAAEVSQAIVGFLRS